MKFFIKYAIAFVVMFSLPFDQLQSAVVQGTLIATADGPKRVELLRAGEKVFGFDATTKTMVQAPITAINKCTSKSIIFIIIDQDIIIAATDQQLFDPVANRWITASDLTTSNYLVDSKGHHIKCCALIPCSMDEEIFTIYDISTTDPHTFFATEEQVLTHNVVPIAIGLSIAFGETLASISLGEILFGIGAFIFGTTAGVKINQEQAVQDFEQYFMNPLDDENKKEHILQGKHNWKDLVPDPKKNWDDVVKIINTTMDKGVHGPYQNSKTVMVAAAIVAKRIVEVTYIVKNGVERVIGNAWVK